MNKQPETSPQGDNLERALTAANQLVLFAGVLKDQTGESYLQLLNTISEGNNQDLQTIYTKLLVHLAEEAELYPDQIVGDAWQNHLLDRILMDDNAFSRKAQMAGAAAIGASLMRLANHEIACLRRLYEMDNAQVQKAMLAALNIEGDTEAPGWLIGWKELRSLPQVAGASETARTKTAFAQEKDWSALASRLASHYARRGTGTLARFRAFRWQNINGRAQLEGIAVPDPIRMADLIGYQRERQLLISNTEQFLAGHPANNVLLYGDRGTGKSSSVKALLNEYADQGLRLIEVSRQMLNDYADIAALVRTRPEKFILFIDDLSFDEHETGYKGLKAILEGETFYFRAGLEARPDNLVLYATSNRRHLVQERFADRAGAANTDEIHVQDTSQEKLSLSDRFGITITFLSPDQERYLEIVFGLAERRALNIEEEELRRRALAWATRYNGRSGRTARQFIDYLTGEMTL